MIVMMKVEQGVYCLQNKVQDEMSYKSQEVYICMVE